MADFGFARFGDEEEEDEDGSGYQAWGNQRDGLIFLIDASKSMFDAADDDDCLFQLCLKIVKTTMQNKIISSERDVIGTVFFGTVITIIVSLWQNSLYFSFILQDLDQPGAQRILDLEEFEAEGIKKFSKQFGHSPTYSLSEALWTCMNMFSKAEGSQKMGSKRIMLFTNNDNPHAGSPHMRQQAEAKASDLNNNGIDLELMHLQNPNETFDIEKFYKPLLFMDDDELTELPDPAERMEELLRRVRSKDHKKRALRRIPFSLGEGLSFSVGVYTLVRSCPKPSAIKLSKREHAKLKSNSKVYLPETGEILMPQDLKKAQTYGGNKICFENDEVTGLKRFDPAGSLYLMGFKPRSSLKKYHHVKPAQFLYPDENKISGSTTLFTALLKKCLERDVTPICKYIPGRNFPPRFVTLLPQAEEVDEHKVQVTPPGFHVIFLPFADDFRKVNYDEECPRGETILLIILSKTATNYEHILVLVYVCFFLLPIPVPPEDVIKRAGRVLDEFRDLVYPADYVPGQKRKHRHVRCRRCAAAKKAKNDEALVSLDVRAEAEAGRLGKLTVAVLKDILKKEKINTAATRKNDIIDAINNHFGV
ncbi:hypothetical protein EGW08_000919 [Elysia chlorotica]|uniref:DNA helicase n=1 Tax=Elysia chlorotica TaxID=188477 RepID=A0A3S1A0H4_ELYCH|nr:hypothetical protein EGW08_000919 [Elysia chlorotica]